MKNRVIAGLTIAFSLFFIIFVINVTKNLSNAKKDLLKSPNIVDVTDIISSRILVTSKDLPIEGDWSKSEFKDSDWSPIKIPSYQLIKNKEFAAGNFVYYRIKLPQKAFDSLAKLQDESFLALQYVYFSKLDIIINGKFYSSNKPVNSMEASIIVPVKEDLENLISIKGYIKTADTGIDHRDKILLGRGAELTELHRASFKAQTVYQLVFILCKGSILFIFALIFLLIKVDISFGKFFIFGLCAVIEELIAGDYLYGPLNLNQMVFLYNFVNLAGAVAVFLFFAELLNLNFSKLSLQTGTFILAAISVLITSDALYWSHFFNLDSFMKFWNLVTVLVMMCFLPKSIKFDRILFFSLCSTISLYLWGALFSSNIGLNLKAYGNLLLFIMVAYQTFVLFSREQIQMQSNERKLLEQEKMVAIGNTASLLAHDIRKPLEQMKLLLDKVASGNADKAFLNIAKEDIDYSIENVDRQVNDIMNFTKTSKATLTDISFYKLLSHSIKQVMIINQEMDIKLGYKFDADVKVLGDQSRLSGALVNLIGNAVEAIRDIGNKKTGKISFKTYCSETEFIFKIFNDGPQIPDEMLNQIFKPLFTHGKISGTGLGLASVTKTLGDHLGSIKVENIDNEGVEFTVRLNSSSAKDDINLSSFLADSKSYSYNPSSEIITTTRPSLRVLIVENLEANIQHLQKIINELPFNVSLTVVENYELALEQITKTRFDIYILSFGAEFYKKHLNFLSKEVILLGNIDTAELHEIDCQHFQDPLTLKNLNSLAETIYQNRTKVLLVDDTKLIRVAWMMFHGQHNITCVSSPEEALSIIQLQPGMFDVFVLDFHFDNSVMDGEGLGKKIRELRTDAHILISSSIDQKLSLFKSISKRAYEIRNMRY